MAEKPEQSRSEEGLMPIDPSVPEPAQALIRVCRKVMLSEKGEAALMQTLQGAKSLPHAASMVVFSLIQRGLESTGAIPPEIVFADGGVTDYLMDLLFALAQQNEIPGAVDEEGQENYIAAMDLVDEFAGQLMTAENGMEEGAGTVPTGTQPAPPSAPPAGAPAPLMAR